MTKIYHSIISKCSNGNALELQTDTKAAEIDKSTAKRMISYLKSY